MKLINVDAEILKIESEIKGYEARIHKWKEFANGRIFYEIDFNIKKLQRKIEECNIEIKWLKQYETVDLEAHDKEIRDKAIDEFVEQIEKMIFGCTPRRIVLCVYTKGYC